MVARRFLIFGIVQGVGYRFFVMRAAARHQMLGTVRNLPDGTVEAEASGPQEIVEKLIAWCRQGPPSASVTGVEVEWIEDAEADPTESGRFIIR